MRLRATALGMLVVCHACALDTGASEVEVELRVRGTQLDEAFVGRDGVRISLRRAELAFGPLYLCRGRRAGQLCETAALEWTEATVVDALDADPEQAGTLVGLEGRVRSFMYDLGLHSLLTEPQPLVLEAAEKLGGHSVVLVGEAEQAGRSFPFRFEVAVAQGPDNPPGVPVVSAAGEDVFDQQVDADTRRLTVVFDPRPWLRNVRFEAFVDARTCADPEEPASVCDGDILQTCDEAGGVEEERDCAAEGEVCVAGQGCREAFGAGEGSQAFLAVRNALVAGQRPEFRWSSSD